MFADVGWLRFVLWLVGKFGISCAFTALYVYAAELFPTHLRSGGIGACEVGARVGGTLAPAMHSLVSCAAVNSEHVHTFTVCDAEKNMV